MTHRFLNINVGVLGHVDSGKTRCVPLLVSLVAGAEHADTFPFVSSVVKALSSILSTAALDKAPQSRQRGMTMDLGFSALAVDAPDSLKVSYDKVMPVEE